MIRIAAIAAIAALGLSAVLAGCGGGKSEPKGAEEVERELARGREVNDYDANGLTMLHKYSKKGGLAAVEKLLWKDAKTNSPVRRPPNLAYTALHFAAAGGHVKVADALIKAGTNVNIAAVGEKDLGSVDGKTPLHVAAENGQKAMVEFLLKEGASTSATDANGKTAAELAEGKGHADVAAMVRAAKK
jgi:ankyrin repeat protein